ncbi:unnamed protein product [Durusdinium trenchii]|uniref:Secreted protein n=1 Tax=Durusdinium trenchii TaxID=1381693 RepID=A0ABP0RRE5_9DINO
MTLRVFGPASFWALGRAFRGTRSKSKSEWSRRRSPCGKSGLCRWRRSKRCRSTDKCQNPWWSTLRRQCRGSKPKQWKRRWKCPW